MASTINHNDSTGRKVHEGDCVRYGTYKGQALIGRVVIVEGPIPGSWATREGLGTLYIRRSQLDPAPDSMIVCTARDCFITCSCHRGR